MTLLLGRFGIWRTVSGITPGFAEEIESLGYGAVWVGGSPAGHLEDLEKLLDATTRIKVATGILNMWKADADTVADSYHRIARRHPDRFLLGLGIGHPEATKEYHHPYDKIVGYLDRLETRGVPKDRLALAALGPRVLTLAGERTAGAHPYLTTPRHTGYARQVLGPGPLLAPEHKVVLDTDPVRARSVGRPVVSRYLDRVNYRNNLLREGWDEGDFDGGGSDRLVDALVLHGTPDDVAAGVRAHLDAGADHVAIQVIGDGPLGAYRELSEALFG